MEVIHLLPIIQTLFNFVANNLCFSIFVVGDLFAILVDSKRLHVITYFTVVCLYLGIHFNIVL